MDEPQEKPQTCNLEELERDAVERALAMCKGNKSQSARILGISRTTLVRKLRRFGIVQAT